MEPYKPGLHGADKEIFRGSIDSSNRVPSTPVSTAVEDILNHDASQVVVKTLSETKVTIPNSDKGFDTSFVVANFFDGISEQGLPAIPRFPFAQKLDAYLVEIPDKTFLIPDSLQVIEEVRKHPIWMDRQNISALVARITYMAEELESNTNEKKEIYLTQELENTIWEIRRIIYLSYDVVI